MTVRELIGGKLSAVRGALTGLIAAGQLCSIRYSIFAILHHRQSVREELRHYCGWRSVCTSLPFRRGFIQALVIQSRPSVFQPWLQLEEMPLTLARSAIGVILSLTQESFYSNIYIYFKSNFYSSQSSKGRPFFLCDFLKCISFCSTIHLFLFRTTSHFRPRYLFCLTSYLFW